MPTSVALCRWNGGWHEVVDQSALAGFGRSEAFLSLGAQQSVGEVIRVATRELEDSFAKVREQTTLEHRPTNLAEIPYVAYQPSNRITAPNFAGSSALYQVQSMAVTEDDDGQLQFVPTVGDTIIGVEELQEQIALTARARLANGMQSVASTPP